MKFEHDHLTRQMDLLPLEKLGEPITIIGAGAIGSFLTLALCKMGFQNVTVFDDDQIQIENMSCSLYRYTDIGRAKVTALQELIYQFTSTTIDAKQMKYDGTIRPGIVISAVDSMLVRKEIWDAHQAKGVHTRAIIDPRMGAETALIYVMNPMSPTDAESYRKALYTDDNAVSEPCTRKATMYCALSLSGYVACQVKSLVTGQPYLRTVQWDLPSGQLNSWQAKLPG